MKKLVIIDGKSVFYRGYYAMGALSLKDGTPTGGVYGFAVIALKLVQDLSPDKVVVAWDKAKTSIEKRKAIYADYKAGRQKPPEDFFAQIPLLRQLILDLHWEFVECDGYEADDIIGTLSRQADETGDYETTIISSDLDMLQVVDENTKMYRLLKGFSELEEIDVAAVEEKYGILKSQFLDLKALKGDASDNIPGVPGIGEKTAVKLLNEYGTLDGIYEHVAEISGAVNKKLVAGKTSAYMSYELAKIMTDAPVELDKMREFEISNEEMKEALSKLEFNSLIRKIASDFSNSSFTIDEIKVVMHKDVERAREMAKEMLMQFSGSEKEREVLMQFDLPLIPVLVKMEELGIKISRSYFGELEKEFQKKVNQIEQKIFEMAGATFNLNSPVQLSEILFDKLGLPTKGIKKTKRGYSTGAKELNKLKKTHAIVQLIMEYREVAKLLSTYVKPLPDLADQNDRIHTTFTQDVTSTGRLSSINPNLQNIPVRTEEGKRIRSGFVADDGKSFVSADYSQFELRLAAVLAGDQNLISDFNAGIDIHTKTAADVFGVPMEEVTKEQRRAAKTINFGVLYGMSAKGLADAANMSVPEAKQFIEGYFEVRKPIKQYLDRILQQARNEGYVETYFGRKRLTPDVKSPIFLIRTGAERAAQNMPIQGTEADLMKRAMINLDKVLPKGANLILQIHDSVIVECDDEEVQEVSNILKSEMEQVAPELKIKLAVDVTTGKNWGEL